jgi:hypothetical protein
MRCLFIEKGSAAFSKLKSHCDGIADIEVTAENWDLTEHVQGVVRFARERMRSFPFVFIDPTGWEQLQTEIIGPILALNPGEVLITFMTSWITRFLSDESKHFERLIGDDWKTLIHLRGEEQEDALVNSYAKRVRAAGQFKYVCTLPVMKPSQDAFHFRMIYATRHVKGVEVFKETEKYVIPFMHEARAEAQERRRFGQSGQYTLLDPRESYKETRFTRFRSRNLAAAKVELREKLESGKHILYDDAWADVMQHSAVTDADLQQWLIEWKNQKLLEIINQTPRQRVARKGVGQHLKWKTNR